MVNIPKIIGISEKVEKSSTIEIIRISEIVIKIPQIE